MRSLVLSMLPQEVIQILEIGQALSVTRWDFRALLQQNFAHSFEKMGKNGAFLGRTKDLGEQSLCFMRSVSEEDDEPLLRSHTVEGTKSYQHASS